MTRRLRLAVFGRLVLAEEKDGEWRFFYPGEGKRRPADDLRVDPGLDVQQCSGLWPISSTSGPRPSTPTS